MLSNRQIGPRQLQFILQLLSEKAGKGGLPTLSTLDVSRNSLGAEGIRIISEWIADSQNTEEPSRYSDSDSEILWRELSQLMADSKGPKGEDGGARQEQSLSPATPGSEAGSNRVRGFPAIQVLETGQ